LAATVTSSDSIVSLATSATKNYTFTDPASVQSVVIAGHDDGYSPTISPASLQSLDGDTRVGGNNQNGFIDGSGVNFSAASCRPPAAWRPAPSNSALRRWACARRTVPGR